MHWSSQHRSYCGSAYQYCGDSRRSESGTGRTCWSFGTGLLSHLSARAVILSGARFCALNSSTTSESTVTVSVPSFLIVTCAEINLNAGRLNFDCHAGRYKLAVRWYIIVHLVVHEYSQIWEGRVRELDG